MSRINQPRARWALSAVAVAAVALLTACGRPADSTATTPNNSGRPAVVTDSGKSAAQLGNEAKQGVREAGQAVANKTKDIAITTEINTLLARDDQLSALKINVDTSAGQVVLQGSAPNDAARARAADLARSVGGVLNVDNKVQVAQARN